MRPALLAKPKWEADGTPACSDIPHLDTPQRSGKVGGGIERDPLRCDTIAPGTADLLPVGLDGGRRIGMDDEANVWFVDPHTGGDGRHHHSRLGLEELLQPGRTHVFVRGRQAVGLMKPSEESESPP